MNKLASHCLLALLVMGGGAGSAETRSDVVYRQVDGISLALDAFIPESAGPFPAIVYVHGGGFVTGDKRPHPVWLDLAAAEGFAWFSVNYRLAPKYLASHQVEDVEAAVRFVQAHASVFK